MAKAIQKYINGTSALQYFNLLRFGTTILIMVILAKSSLTQQEIAQYELFWFLISMLSFFWVAASINALLSYLPKQEESVQKKILFNVFVLFTVISLGIGALFYFSSGWFMSVFGVEKELPVLHLLCLFLAFQTPSWLVQVIYLLLEKFRLIFVYGTVVFFLQILAVLVPLLMGLGLYEIFFSLVIVAIFRFLWLLILIFKHTEQVLDLQLMRPLLLLALPLVLKSLLGRSYEYADGFIVTSFFEDENSFAIFRYGAREMPYVALFIGAVVTAMLPIASRNLPESMETLKQKATNLSRWMYPISILLLFISPFVFENVFNAEFKESAYIFNAYLLLLSSQMLMSQVVIMAKQKNYLLLLASAVELIVNIVLSLILVRIWGLLGIALASVVAFYVDKIIHIVYLKTKLGIEPRQYIPLKNHFMWTFLLYGAFVLSLFVHGQINAL